MFSGGVGVARSFFNAFAIQPGKPRRHAGAAHGGKRVNLGGRIDVFDIAAEDAFVELHHRVQVDLGENGGRRGFQERGIFGRFVVAAADREDGDGGVLSEVRQGAQSAGGFDQKDVEILQLALRRDAQDGRRVRRRGVDMADEST